MKSLFDFSEYQLANSSLVVGGRGGGGGETNPKVTYGESSASNEETGMGDCTDDVITEKNDDGTTETCEQWTCPD